MTEKKKDSKVGITVLLQRTRETIVNVTKKDMLEELSALVKAVEEDNEVVRMERALNGAGVLVSMQESKIGTLNMAVAQHKAVATKEKTRNESLAERIVILQAENYELKKELKALKKQLLDEVTESESP